MYFTHCPPGWTKGVDNECLIIHGETNTKTNYTTALKTCAQKYNAKLISIKSAAKNNFITQWFKDQKFDAYFWLDATRVLKTDNSDSFYWYNGDQLTYTNWVVGEPNGNNLGDIEGVEVCINVEAPSSPMNCPCGWTKGVDNDCLLIPDLTSNGSNYTTALKTCAQKYNAKLISIKSAAKNNFITQWLKGQKFGAYFWLDATRVLKADSSDSFIWSNGDQLTYTNWAESEPNGNNLGGIDAVELLN
ncbi:unnamed protein product [Oppiella nova]|uniref:C-type lectin domain-containing protein n=1 Tax=Oppiella nova TaxID=334625 RepID=A0A7R9MBJ7_9ACAR|nr:unnamed protein product [Oppiella nova]CAG2174361.1 unnamed protein product [Oppiella nova]